VIKEHRYRFQLLGVILSTNRSCIVHFIGKTGLFAKLHLDIITFHKKAISYRFLMWRKAISKKQSCYLYAGEIIS